MAITNLTGTKWVLKDTIVIGEGFNEIVFACDNIIYTRLLREGADFGYSNYNDDTYVYDSYTDGKGGWYDEKYKTIIIFGGNDSSNNNLITWFEQNAILIEEIKLHNSAWKFNENVSYDYFETRDISFVSNGKHFDSLYFENGEGLNYYDSVIDEGVLAYNQLTNKWKKSNYSIIKIIGDGNADLFAFLYINAKYIKPTEFDTIKTELKIYDDLSNEEYASLDKETNSFYFVNNDGIYKGSKMIATNLNTDTLDTRYLTKLKYLTDSRTNPYASSFSDFVELYDIVMVEVEAGQSSFKTIGFIETKSQGDGWTIKIKPTCPVFLDSRDVGGDGGSYIVNNIHFDKTGKYIYVYSLVNGNSYRFDCGDIVVYKLG